MENKGKGRIKILPNGPYEVTGHVPLKQAWIMPDEGSVRMQIGDTYDTEEGYHLCRCGRSKNKPFCDGSHKEAGFDGTETAGHSKYADRALRQEGPALDLLDDDRCAYARFCHNKQGTEVWTLTDQSDDPQNADDVRDRAPRCPSGRLVVQEKDGTVLENDYPQAILVLEDPSMRVSAGLAVSGGVVLEGADGKEYEVRNRYTLCRCGRSLSKPFCRAEHVMARFNDGKVNPPED